MQRVDAAVMNATEGSLMRYMCAGYETQKEGDRYNGVADISGNEKLSPLHTTLSGYATCRCTENSGLSDGSRVSSDNTVVVSATC